MGWISAAIGAASSIFGGMLGAKNQSGEASALRDWQAMMYGKRYQMTMADMRAAGLNPMLAYSQGPGQSPSGAMSKYTGDFGGAAAGSALAQAGIRGASAKAAKAQANLASTTEEKTKEEVQTARQHARLEKMKADDYQKYGTGAAANLLVTGERSGKRASKSLWKAKPGPRRKTKVEVLRSLKRAPKMRKAPPIPQPRHPKWR